MGDGETKKERESDGEYKGGGRKEERERNLRSILSRFFRFSVTLNDGAVFIGVYKYSACI